MQAIAEITAHIEEATRDLAAAADRNLDYLALAQNAADNLETALDRVNGYGGYTGTNVSAVTAHLDSALEDALAVANQTGDYLAAVDCGHASALLALDAFKTLTDNA